MAVQMENYRERQDEGEYKERQVQSCLKPMVIHNLFCKALRATRINYR